jgi:hypothetical protein
MWRIYIFALAFSFAAYFGTQALGFPTALVLVLTLVAALSGSALGAYFARPR